jgi:hypothetical protein
MSEFDTAIDTAQQEQAETPAVDTVQQEQIEEPAADRWTLRPLTARDVRPMTVILSKVGVKEFAPVLRSPDVLEVFTSIAGKGDDATAMDISYAGVTALVEIAGILLANYGRAEDELFALLGDIAGLTADEVGALPLEDFTGLLVAVVKKKDFKGFFTAVSKLLK